MEDIIGLLHTGGYSCVIKKNTEIRTFTQRGVADLYDLYQTDASFMLGASVADKVIGKGAAALMVLGGIKQVYADVISTPALEVLQQAGVSVSFSKEVPHIINRNKTGWCPLETACDKIKSVQEMFPVIRDFITTLRTTKKITGAFLACLLGSYSMQAQQQDSLQVARTITTDEVVVTGTRNATDIRHLPMTISIIDRPTIEQRYEPSLLPVLTEQVPGFFTTSRGIMGYGVSIGAAGGMTLRGIGGSPTTGLLVLIDGHPQYMGLMGHPIADAYQTMLAERVEVLRGPASVLYGSNAMGGVVNIVTRKQQENGIKTTVNMGGGSYGTLQTEASNQIKKDRFSSVVTASYNRTDGHRENMAFEQYGGYAKLGYDLTENWKIWGDANVTHYNASNPGTISKPLIDNDSRITRGMTSIALENHSDKTSGTISFFYNWGRHKINDGYSPDEQPQTSHFNSKDKMMGISWYQSATFFEGNRLTLGFDYQHFGGESWYQVVETGKRNPGVDKQMDEFAGYMDIRQNISNWLSLDAGIRIDHHSHVGTEVIPQGGLALHLPNYTEAKAMVSKGYRNPTIREMFMFSANPELQPESLINYELSFSQHLLENRLSYSANLYYINGENLIIAVPVDGRMQNTNTGKVENWGVETTFSYRFNASWNMSSNYSWLHMKYPVVASPEHKLFVGVDFTQNRWQVSTGIQYIKGLYTTVKDGNGPQENFVLWNLRGNYRLCNLVQLYIKGENLLAQRYEINAGYPMPKATVMGGINLSF